MTKILQIVSMVTAIVLTGCTAVLHDAVVHSYPSYKDTMKNAPSLQKNMGRIVIFYPRLPMAGFNPIAPVGGFATVGLSIDTTEHTSVGDATFVFIDLPAGRHLV